jgi:hypothetical protein
MNFSYVVHSLMVRSDKYMSDYLIYRGRCKEMADNEIKNDPSLRLVRGYYRCPIWGIQPHWWCVKPDNTIIDPSVRQFPTAGIGADYEEFDGFVNCEYCSKRVSEDEIYRDGHHAYCSGECYGHDVGF